MGRRRQSWLDRLGDGAWLRLCIAIVVAVDCLAIAAWLITRPAPPVDRAAQPAPTALPRTGSEHSGGKVQFDILAKLLADDRRSAPPDAWLREVADLSPPQRTATQSHPLLDRAVPDFTLSDHRDRSWSLQQQLARGPVVLVFYLGYYCNACIHNLFELNADLQRFHSLGTEVVAISGDPPEATRQRFAQFGAFSFPVLFDPDHRVARAYGMFQPASNSKSEELLHGTLIIARDGRLRWVHRGDAPFRDNMALLHEVARVENKLPSRELAPLPAGNEAKSP